MEGESISQLLPEDQATCLALVSLYWSNVSVSGFHIDLPFFHNWFCSTV